MVDVLSWGVLARGKFKLKIDLSLKTPWQKYRAVEGSKWWAPDQNLTQHRRIYSLDQHEQFELHLIRLLCSSQTFRTQSNHRFIENGHIWSWTTLSTVSIWSILNWMFHFRLFAMKPASFPLDALGYIQVCSSSTHAWKCCFIL